MNLNVAFRFAVFFCGRGIPSSQDAGRLNQSLNLRVVGRPRPWPNGPLADDPRDAKKGVGYRCVQRLDALLANAHLTVVRERSL